MTIQGTGSGGGIMPKLGGCRDYAPPFDITLQHRAGILGGRRGGSERCGVSLGQLKASSMASWAHDVLD